MESRSLTRLLADVRYVGDQQSLTDRHPDADITNRLNASVRSLRALVTANGLPYFLTNTAAATLAGTRVTDESYSEVPWPATAVQIHGVDVEFTGSTGDWYPLTPITWVQRRTLAYAWERQGPRAFAVRAIPTGSGSSTVAGAIALFPGADSGRYKIWFLPEFTDLSSGTDVLLGLPEWHEWIVQDVVRTLAERDDDQRETYQIATAKQAEAEARLLASVGRVVSAGPLRPRRGRRRV
jgi:hypothetical protein